MNSHREKSNEGKEESKRTSPHIPGHTRRTVSSSCACPDCTNNQEKQRMFTHVHSPRNDSIAVSRELNLEQVIAHPFPTACGDYLMSVTNRNRVHQPIPPPRMVWRMVRWMSAGPGVAVSTFHRMQMEGETPSQGGLRMFQSAFHFSFIHPS